MPVLLTDQAGFPATGIPRTEAALSPPGAQLGDRVLADPISAAVKVGPGPLRLRHPRAPPAATFYLCARLRPGPPGPAACTRRAAWLGGPGWRPRLRVLLGVPAPHTSGAPTLYLPHLPGASTLAGWSGDASHFPGGGLAEPRVKCCWVSSGAPQNGDGFSHPRAALTMSACRLLRWPRTEGKGAWWPIGRGPRRPQPGVPSRAGILLVTFRCRLGGSGPGTLHFQLASWRCRCRWSGSILARAQQVESWERVAYGVSSHVPKMQTGTPVSWGCG